MTQKKLSQLIVQKDPCGLFNDVSINQFRFPDNSFTGRKFLIFGSYDLEEEGKKIKVDTIKERMTQAIRDLGFAFEGCLVREGTEEEMGLAKGKYVVLDKTNSDEVLLHRRYCRPGSVSTDLIDEIDYEFILDHPLDTLPQELRSNHSARLNHMVEDIVAHEYGHKVWQENYFKLVVNGVSDVITKNKSWSDSSLLRLKAEQYSSTAEEAFARWFNYALVGHEHPFDIADLTLFSSEELRAKGQKTYGDREGIADFYTLLKQTSDDQSTKYVLENLPVIAVNFIKGKHDKREEEYIRQAAQLKLKFNPTFCLGDYLSDIIK